MWKSLDANDSGDIELDEFLEYFNKTKADRLLSWRAVKYLTADRPARIEDFMKLTWLKATREDIKTMMMYARECAAEDERIDTPPLISNRTRRQLIKNFKYLDRDGSDNITFDEMVAAELVDADIAKDLVKRYDRNADGTIDKLEFLEMMAPYGYLAHPDQKEVFDKDGNHLEYVDLDFYQGWRIKK